MEYQFSLYFTACQCNEDGSENTNCDNASGKCSCKDHVVGDKCVECEIQYYGFPDCKGIWLEKRLNQCYLLMLIS